MELRSEKKRIFVTDDDPGMQDIFKIILEREGYEVEIYQNGHELMSNQLPEPDLYILDKQLCGADGLDICKFLKSQKKSCKIPIIMISATPTIGVLSKLAGADDYIEKPFDLSHLLKVISRNLP